jgi:hypothetical protein
MAPGVPWGRSPSGQVFLETKVPLASARCPLAVAHGGLLDIAVEALMSVGNQDHIRTKASGGVRVARKRRDCP